MNFELLIQHGDVLYAPVVQEGITWSTERKGCPGELKFKVLKDEALDFTEGDVVRLKVNNSEIFYGFVFKKQRDKDHIISVTAYDQLRYLKNKDTYKIENEKASEFIKRIADDFKLQTGEIEDTDFFIPSRVEKNTALIDMIQTALDLTLENEKQMYVMYDDFGKITLKSLESMKLDLLIDEESGENFDYTSSIDSNTYNKVKLLEENEKNEFSKPYYAYDSNNMNQWGILQYFDTLKEGENGQAKAEALLDLYNKKTRNLSIKNVIGDVRVRAGSLIPVFLSLGDIEVKNYFLVEKCKHEFKDSQHFMELTLRGGEFIV